MAEVRCEHLRAAFGSRTVLEDIELVVPEGTLTAILGESGSGKTTLLRVVMGFTRAERGRVVVGGVVVAEAGRTHLPPERRGVGYVAQEGALYSHLDVGQNVGFGLPRSERRASVRIGEVLDLVGLGRDVAARPVHELSGGEQRRVSLARALAPRPRAVLLDEPFTGLDASLRAETREAVVAALAEEGTTAVLVTHDQAEALSMGREVAVLRGGRLVQTAPPADLYRRPVDADVARFVGEAVLLPGQVCGTTVTCALGSLPLLADSTDGPVETMIRPEQIEIHRAPVASGGPDRDGRVAARVVSRTYYGADTLVRLVLEGSQAIVLARRSGPDVPEPGEAVSITVAGPVVVYARSGTGGGRDRAAGHDRR